MSVKPRDVSQWLRDETPEHLALMSKLRERLAATIETDISDKEAVPSRDWCRAAQRYQQSFLGMLTEERERIKLRLLMNKAGGGGLTDEEYEQELKTLAAESLGTLPVDALHRELERRQQLAAPVMEDEDD